MQTFFVFFCPRGGDRAAAIRGDILCDCMQMDAVSEEAVRAAFPTAVKIIAVSKS
jgi:hypothetical protein